MTGFWSTDQTPQKQNIPNMALTSLQALQELAQPEVQTDLPTLPSDQIKHLMALTSQRVDRLWAIGPAIDLVDEVMAELDAVRARLKRKAEELPDQIAASKARVADLVGDGNRLNHDSWAIYRLAKYVFYYSIQCLSIKSCKTTDACISKPFDAYRFIVIREEGNAVHWASRWPTLLQSLRGVDE